MSAIHHTDRNAKPDELGGLGTEASASEISGVNAMLQAMLAETDIRAFEVCVCVVLRARHTQQTRPPIAHPSCHTPPFPRTHKLRHTHIYTHPQALQLEYHAAWPLSLVISRRAVTKYQLIFRHLFLTKFIERRLHTAWADQQATKVGVRVRVCV